ncbi:MAG: OadG family protein [Oscillospiraceae bacterium]|nr:OadG family protein [Oscillospiraceae bacterium]
MYSTPVILADKVLHGTEKLNGTEILSMTLIGLSVVFFALIILVVYLSCSGVFFKKGGNKPAAPKKTAPQPAAKSTAPAKAAVPAKPAASGEDEEVIAVIMAAIAAMGAADGKQYQLRSVKQVTRGGSGRNIWAQAGVLDATRPF